MNLATGGLIVVVGVVDDHGLDRRRTGGGRHTSASRTSVSRTRLASPWATMVRLTATIERKCWAADARSWVLAITVLPALASASRIRMRSSWVAASTPVTGSSRRYSSGSDASARARKTRRRWPPDRAPIWRWAKSAHADLLRARPQRRHGPPHPADGWARGVDTGPSSRRRQRRPESPSPRIRPAVRRPRTSHVLPANRRGPSSEPVHGLSNPAMSLRRVLLPPPFGPTTAVSAPASSVRSTCSRTARSS